VRKSIYVVLFLLSCVSFTQNTTSTVSSSSEYSQYYVDTLIQLRKLAFDYFTKARSAGLVFLPGYYWMLVTSYEHYWPQIIVEEKLRSTYSSYEEFFSYVSSCCDEVFQESIKNHQKDVVTFQSYADQAKKRADYKGQAYYEDCVQRRRDYELNTRTEYDQVRLILNTGWTDIQSRFSKLYHELDFPNDFDFVFQKGLLLFDEGSSADFIEQIQKIILSGETEKVLENAKKESSEFYLNLAQGYCETNQYVQALDVLNKLINQDPENKTAYFNRAITYFELGNFDLSLQDYLSSGIKSVAISKDSINFSLGLTKGLVQGIAQAGVEFVPSLLSSMYGLAHGLWALAEDPIRVSAAFVQSSRECIDFVKQHTIQETTLVLVPELRELIEKGDDIDDEKKGEIIGNIIGKYGVDIFATAGCTKGMQCYRRLREANNLLTLEAMAISERNRKVIKYAAEQKAEVRQALLQCDNLKVQWDKQGKHIVGHRNYIPAKNKSIFTHSDPQTLFNNFAGTGIKNANVKPGTSGYKEMVDFKEVIGYCVERSTGKRTVTTWGKIHYAKDGFHIVPIKSRR
jgi:hypothetical protein